jgi:hypothetical protein
MNVSDDRQAKTGVTREPSLENLEVNSDDAAS